MKLLSAGLFIPFVCTCLFAGSPGVEAARKWRAEHGPRIVREYAAMLAIPNTAADLPNIRRNAEHIMGEFEKRGAAMQLLELPDVPPVIYGELKAPGAERTYLIYIHYDGQPVDPANWRHDPWRPTLYSAAVEDGGKPIPLPRDGDQLDPEMRLYARSAGDDKLPIPSLLSALDALEHAGVKRTVNLKFFFEGEEEAGSPNLLRYLKAHRDKLQGDAWLFFDGPMHQSRNPMLTFGVRGVTGMEITVYGPSRSLHSGHYGNWAPVPGQMLSRLLATMKDDHGKVLIPGFYDGIVPLTDMERSALARVPSADDGLRRELGLYASEAGNAQLLERLLLPSLTIKGLHSGNVGAKARNVIPSQAVASLGFRLVKGMDPDILLEKVEAHIQAQGYHIVREEPDQQTRLTHPKIARVVREPGGYPAARTNMDHPQFQPVIAAARSVSDKELYLIPSLGGSLPLYYFTDFLQQPVVIVPVANHDNNQHAPDENVRLANLWYGIDLYAALLTHP